MPLPSQETDPWCTCICVLRVIDFAFVFTIYRLDFGTGLMVYMYMCVKGYRLCLCFYDL